MIAHPPPQLMLPQEYLEWEEQQPMKYEYMNGQVFAMTGGTIPHNDIALNLASALKNHLRGKGYNAMCNQIFLHRKPTIGSKSETQC